MILEVLRLLLLAIVGVAAFRGGLRGALALTAVCAYAPIAVLVATASSASEPSILLPFAALLSDHWVVTFAMQMPLYLLGYGLCMKRLLGVPDGANAIRRLCVITARCFLG